MAPELRTFVLTDVESSTALWERAPDAMSSAIALHEEIIREEVERFGGELIRDRGEGDSLFAVFAAPVDAAAAAASFSRQLARTDWPAESPIRVRVAVYTGEAELRDGDYYGTTVNRAARVRSLGFGGQVLLGEGVAQAIRDALPEGTALVDLGPRPLKDLASPEHVYELSLVDADVPPEPLSDADASNDLWIDRLLSSGFVDRDDERRTLVQAWSKAASGERVLALVDGEPGMGKTTLAAAIAQHAVVDGGIVLYGRWDEDFLASFQAFREALSSYARECPRSILRADISGYADEIGRLLPEVVRRIGTASERSDVVVEAERLRLFEAIDAWLVAIASRRPVCLVLDDLHWADRPSLLFLLHLVRSSVRVPLFVLATFRREALVDTDLERFVPELAREENVHRVTLKGLESADVLDLVKRVAKAADAGSPKLAAALRDETGGNPLFLREIVKHLAASDLLHERDRDRIQLPESVRELVRWRLRPLPSPAREALAVAAVIGQEFDFDLLVAAKEMDLTALSDGLEASCRAGILHEANETGDRFAFSHALVRHALLEDLTGARRAGYHWRIGDALEQRDPRPAPGELAHHFCAAVTPARADKAIAYARAAAAQEMDELAFEAAIGHLERALEIQSTMRPEDGVLRCELLLELGHAVDRAGEYGTKRAELFLGAAEQARRLDRPELFARAALGYRGVLPAATEVDPVGLELLEESLERLGPEDTRLRALVLGRLAHSLQLVPPRTRRAELADESVRIARALGDPDVLAESLIYRCWALDGPDDMKDQLAAAHEIRALGEQLGRREIVLRSLHLRSDALFESGDFEALRETLDEMSALAAELRYPEYTRITHAWEAVFAGIEGRYDEAFMIAEDVHQQMIRMGHPQQELVYQGLIFPFTWLRGGMAEQLPLYESIAEMMPERFLLQMLLAWISAEAGALDKAREVVDGIPKETVRELDKNFTWWAAVAGMTEAVTLIGDREWAQLLYDLILPYADRIASSGSTSFTGAASLYLGLLAATLARYDDATEHFEAAIEKHEEMHARPFLAMTQVAFARMLFERGEPGDAERARTLLDAAVAAADELGLRAITYRASLLAQT
jgi:class 3 adenylate cyclase/tetratricopeptide (TPR) repeat protein